MVTRRGRRGVPVNAMAGFGPLLRLNLRRDRLLLPVYVVLFASVAGGSAAATVGVYPDEVSRRAGAELINATPALVAMYGRIYDPASLGAVSVIKLTGMGTALVALVAVLMVIRHTRADEEVGRYELLAAGAVGRFAFLGAAVATAAIGSVGIGSGTAVPWSWPGCLPRGPPPSGSAGRWRASRSPGSAPSLPSSRPARALLEAWASRRSGRPSCSARSATPAARNRAGRLAVADRLGSADPPLRRRPVGRSPLLPLVFGVTSALAAGLLQERRDLGAGVLPPRAGPRHAARWLTGPLALAWRLQRRPSSLGWSSSSS